MEWELKRMLNSYGSAAECSGQPIVGAYIKNKLIHFTGKETPIGQANRIHTQKSPQDTIHSVLYVFADCTFKHLHSGVLHMVYFELVAPGQ